MISSATKQHIFSIKGCFIVSALALSVNSALAQEVGANAKEREIEIIEVSATKRPASIQDVPVSVAAVSAEQMDKIGINDMEDLSILIPNFEINSAAVLPNLYVRGLGGGAAHSIEQSVGRFVDDVYISRAAINLHPFLDVEAVEVLRGPQGTLFGKNTAAGAMILRTANPESDFGYGINLSASSFSTNGGTKEVSGYVTGALSDTVDARLAFIYRDKEGFYENTLNGPDGADREDTGIRAKFLWEAGENTTVGLKLEYMEYEEDGSDTAEIAAFGGPPFSAWQGIATGSGADGDSIIPAALDWVVHYNCGPATDADGIDIGSFCPSRDQESSNITLNVEHKFDAGMLTLVSGLQNYEYTHQFHGLDMGLANLFRAIRHEEYDGFSQEIRFTSTESDTFDYIAGLYFEDSSLQRDQTSHQSFAPLAPVKRTVEEPWTQDTETLALFGQARWKFTENWAAIVGGRWATEDKDFAFRAFNKEYRTQNLLGEDDINRTESRSESKFTPSFTLQWQSSDEVNLYATYAQGHKTGGFSDRIESQDADIQFDAEEVSSFELGAKTTWLDGSFTLNMTYFNMDIEGLQLSTQAGGTVGAFSVDNAADSTSDGIEVELFWYVSDNWTIGGNFSYTDASYEEFIGAADCAERLVNSDGVCELTGEPLIYAPQNKGAVFAEYYADDTFGEWDFSARSDIAFTGDHYTDISYVDAVEQKSYNTINASMRLISPDEDIVISLIGKNLTEEEILAWGIPSGPNILAAMAPPREIVLKLKYRY
jgi:outer membrane receptor protein involved in Fe transport